jgi:membrane-associated phospholipid phosphatase
MGDFDRPDRKCYVRRVSLSQIRIQPRRGLLVAAIVSLVAFVSLAIVVTGQGFDGADQAVRALVHGTPHPLLHGFMSATSFFGGEAGQVPVILIVSGLLWKRGRQWSLSLPVVMAGAGLLQFAAKWGFDRPRPNLDPWGFPSAHVLSLVVLLGYLGYVIATSRRQVWRRTAWTVCAAAVMAVAYSRMHLDAHWLSDVLGGFTIGLAYLFLIIWVMQSTMFSPVRASESGAHAYGDEGPGIDVDPVEVAI